MRVAFLPLMGHALRLTAYGSLLTLAACDKAGKGGEEKEIRDTQPPTIEISEPQVPYGMEGISVKEGTIKLSGSSEDDQRVIKVKWESSRGGKGVAHMTFRGTQTDWEVPEVKLEEGDNRITVTALDPHANAATKTIWIVRNTQIEFISYPDASETDIRLSEATEVIFRVAVQESAKVKIESVKVVKVNENNEVMDTLATMYDDGKSEHGDEVPADGVYTAKVTLLEGTEGKVRFRVIVSGVKEGAGAVTVNSEPFAVEAIRIRTWTKEEKQQTYALGEQAEKMYFDLKEKEGEDEALRRTVEWLKKQPGVVNARFFEGGFGFMMESGMEGGYMRLEPKFGSDPSHLQPEFDEGWEEDCIGDVCTTTGPSDQSSPRPRKLGLLRYKTSRRGGLRSGLVNPKVLIASAFPGQLDPRAYDAVDGLFKNHRCPIFDKERVKGRRASIDLFKRMGDYNIVILDTHGQALCREADGGKKRCPCGSLAPPGAIVVTLSGTPWSEERDDQHAVDIGLGRIVGYPFFDHYAITPRFVRKYVSSPEGSVVWNGSCRSLYNSSMAQAFLPASGAGAYFGYNEYVSVAYDSLMVGAVFNPLLKGYTTGQAYDEAFRTHGTSPNPNCPDTRSVLLILGGKPDVKITIDGFNNGSFESGDVSGWDAKGDVQVITKIGPLGAQDGNYMAFLTTGEKSENETESSLSQPFCVPGSVSKIAFDYRLVSEEPMEFVNSAWRDTFEASLDVAGTKTVLVSENTDKGPWSAVTGVDFEGGDHTAFATDWKTVASELPEAARKEGAVLAFHIKDGGDYIYDTSVLIDGVRME